MGKADYSADELYCAGAPRVVLINVDAARADPASQVWTWQASDSQQIAAEHQIWLQGVDECKPVRNGTCVLVCSSWQGGVALVRRADRKCLFYTGGVNAHSAAMVGDDLLAAAFSHATDKLGLYPLNGEAFSPEPAWCMDLPGGHGAVWDPRRQVLWALGSKELLKLAVTMGEKPSATVLARWPLPTDGGHDLFAYDEGCLAVTTCEQAYLFGLAGETFRLLPALGDRPNLKSVSRHPQTGRVAYTQGERVFTKTAHIVGEEAVVLPLDEKTLYKVRWNAPCAFEAHGSEGGSP